MANDNVQDLSIAGLRYARFLTNGLSAEDLPQGGYSYLEVYSYGQLDVSGLTLFRVQQTPVIDLTKSLDEIFKDFHTLTRRSIRKAEAISDLTFRIPDHNVRVSFALYKRIKRQDGVFPDLRREFQNCVFFNAYYKDEIISSISFYDNGACLRCKHIVSFRKHMGGESNVAAYAARTLVWEICKYAKERGYQKLDLGGINFDDPMKRGIAQFKSSFGGTIKDVYVYRYETRHFAFLKKLLNAFGRNIH